MSDTEIFISEHEARDHFQERIPFREDREWFTTEGVKQFHRLMDPFVTRFHPDRRDFTITSVRYDLERRGWLLQVATKETQP